MQKTTSAMADFANAKEIKKEASKRKKIDLINNSLKK